MWSSQHQALLRFMCFFVSDLFLVDVSLACRDNGYMQSRKQIEWCRDIQGTISRMAYNSDSREDSDS